jgi:hypothetical protein
VFDDGRFLSLRCILSSEFSSHFINFSFLLLQKTISL